MKSAELRPGKKPMKLYRKSKPRAKRQGLGWAGVLFGASDKETQL